MCSPPSWKSSEGEDVEGDYSVWSSNKEDNEESDWSPEPESKLIPFCLRLVFLARNDQISHCLTTPFSLLSWGFEYDVHYQKSVCVDDYW